MFFFVLVYKTTFFTRDILRNRARRRTMHQQCSVGGSLQHSWDFGPHDPKKHTIVCECKSNSLISYACNTALWSSEYLRIYILTCRGMRGYIEESSRLPIIILLLARCVHLSRIDKISVVVSSSWACSALPLTAYSMGNIKDQQHLLYLQYAVIFGLEPNNKTLHV